LTTADNVKLKTDDDFADNDAKEESNKEEKERHITRPRFERRVI